MKNTIDIMNIITPLIIVLLIGIIKGIVDTIRVPERFNVSIFKNYKGNEFIDPQVSWTTQHELPWWAYPFLVHFSDLWHLLNSVIISLFLILAFTFNYIDVWDNVSFGYFINFMCLWIAYGIGMESCLKVIIKKK